MSTATEKHINNQLAGLLKPRAASDISLSKQTIMLFGCPGSGKTSIAAQFPNHMYLDLENSATAHDIDELEIKTWPALVSFLTDVESGVIDLAASGKETLVIDTVNDLWKLCKAEAFRVLSITDASGSEHGAGYTKPRQMFRDLIDIIMSIAKKNIMGTVFIAHEVMEESTAGNVKVQVAKPEIDDKTLVSFIAAKPQMVLRTLITDTHPVTGVPLLNKEVPPRAESKWLIQARPEVPGAIVKERSGRLPAFLNATYKSLETAYNKEKAS